MQLLMQRARSEWRWWLVGNERDDGVLSASNHVVLHMVFSLSCVCCMLERRVHLFHHHRRSLSLHARCLLRGSLCTDTQHSLRKNGWTMRLPRGWRRECCICLPRGALQNASFSSGTDKILFSGATPSLPVTLRKRITGFSMLFNPNPPVGSLLDQDTMDGLGSAASVIAVLDLSVKVASLCFQYSKAVKNAKPDIERLRGELDRLKTVLEGALQLFETPNGARLQTSQRLRDGLDGCTSQLAELQTKLEAKLNSRPARRVISRFGIHALKWPFESKGVDGIITTLAHYRDTLSAALAVDQT